jgi:hypothetical protein
VLRLGAMGHGCAPSLSQQSASFYRIPLVRSRVSGLLNCSNRIASRSRTGRSSIRYQRSGNSLQPEFQKRAVMDFEQPVGDVNSVIRVDVDQVNEGRMMELSQILAARLYR